MKRYAVIDISGDVGLRSYGENLRDAFINAAIGMYSLITELEIIREGKTIEISIESDSLEGLLVSWLNELIFHFDAYGFIGKRITFTEFTPDAQEVMGENLQRLKATLSGEDFDPDRHERKLLVKAATYHRLSLEKRDGTWEIDVIFDI